MAEASRELNFVQEDMTFKMTFHEEIITLLENIKETKFSKEDFEKCKKAEELVKVTHPELFSNDDSKIKATGMPKELAMILIYRTSLFKSPENAKMADKIYEKGNLLAFNIRKQITKMRKEQEESDPIITNEIVNNNIYEADYKTLNEAFKNLKESYPDFFEDHHFQSLSNKDEIIKNLIKAAILPKEKIAQEDIENAKKGHSKSREFMIQIKFAVSEEYYFKKTGGGTRKIQHNISKTPQMSQTSQTSQMPQMSQMPQILDAGMPMPYQANPLYIEEYQRFQIPDQRLQTPHQRLQMSQERFQMSHQGFQMPEQIPQQRQQIPYQGPMIPHNGLQMPYNSSQMGFRAYSIPQIPQNNALTDFARPMGVVYPQIREPPYYYYFQG